ncbi:hypothetical protein ACWGK1_13640 [Streptomyces wedmorensis]
MVDQGLQVCDLATFARGDVAEDGEAVATRYEKRACIYLGTVTLAALIIWLRT